MSQTHSQLSESAPEKGAFAYNLAKHDHIEALCEDLDQEGMQREVEKHLLQLTQRFVPNYNVLFLFDEFTLISSWEANTIYQALNQFSEEKDLLLVLHSIGGSIEPAYLISQTCKKKTKQKFCVTVPRKAKSAATLLSLGADEIHMGMLSELGPIDPQIKLLGETESWPALGVGHSLEYIAKLVCQHPGSASMFAQYLTNKLEPNQLGYFERVSESAVQYAERLLGTKEVAAEETVQSVAGKLVYHYKDHDFVIDIDEATKLLGSTIVRKHTSEYQFGSEVYDLFDRMTLQILKRHDRHFTYVGNVSSGLKVVGLSS
ncbi:SDH family Clp fold serine proteinase [Flaviaesturariibacter amylovorans]|uniref:ATP-dependent Clp protease proteolytic subunit n=1 Tax=Flaviaesturariibacter amylovorans TaxID=1084520 RepID=A0ABP8HL77_9BACT